MLRCILYYSVCCIMTRSCAWEVHLKSLIVDWSYLPRTYIRCDAIFSIAYSFLRFFLVSATFPAYLPTNDRHSGTCAHANLQFGNILNNNDCICIYCRPLVMSVSFVLRKTDTVPTLLGKFS